MPLAEVFLKDKNTIAKYLPEDAAIQSFAFDTCKGSNCFDFIPKGKDIDENAIIL